MKTVTLSDSTGNPTITLCRGKVTATEFNKAFRNEGWDRGDWIPKRSLAVVRLIEFKKKHFRPVKKGERGFVATVMDW